MERRVFQKFKNTNFIALETKDKEVRSEVARYRLRTGIKRTKKWTAISVTFIVLRGFAIYQIVLDSNTRGCCLVFRSKPDGSGILGSSRKNPPGFNHDRKPTENFSAGQPGAEPSAGTNGP